MSVEDLPNPDEKLEELIVAILTAEWVEAEKAFTWLKGWSQAGGTPPEDPRGGPTGDDMDPRMMHWI